MNFFEMEKSTVNCGEVTSMGRNSIAPLKLEECLAYNTNIVETQPSIYKLKFYWRIVTVVLRVR